jgi:hypothetical protein
LQREQVASITWWSNPTVSNLRLTSILQASSHREHLELPELRQCSDFLNNVDSAFPDFQIRVTVTSFVIQRNCSAFNITNNIVNEARMGFVGGITLFFGEVNASQFANQGGVNLH